MGKMARTALATLANSSGLEIGEILIVSFGGEMKVLHSFEKLFTNESGMELTDNLLFDETCTMMVLCVDSAMMMLEDSGSAADLQTFFINLFHH